jgi:hypothetical protein
LPGGVRVARSVAKADRVAHLPPAAVEPVRPGGGPPDVGIYALDVHRAERARLQLHVLPALDEQACPVQLPDSRFDEAVLRLVSLGSPSSTISMALASASLSRFRVSAFPFVFCFISRLVPSARIAFHNRHYHKLFSRY